jgi:ribosomal subunit interface protein
MQASPAALEKKTMRLPLQVTFRNFPHSEAIEANISEKAAKLDRFNERIMSCRVVVEASQRRQHQGKLFSVRIDLTVPGKELAVTREENEDVYVAVRDAFDSAGRRLEEHARRLRGVVKSHETQPSGRIIKIFPDEQYGFIETHDSREIYFHRNSVQDEAFSRLKIGTEVGFVEEQGEEGPQAARVTVGKR